MITTIIMIIIIIKWAKSLDNAINPVISRHTGFLLSCYQVYHVHPKKACNNNFIKSRNQAYNMHNCSLI